MEGVAVKGKRALAFFQSSGAQGSLGASALTSLTLSTTPIVAVAPFLFFIQPDYSAIRDSSLFFSVLSD